MALPDDLLPAALATFPACRRLVVGVSGGVDSMLLLDLAREYAAGRLPLLVVHVHHGLHPHADDWAARVQRACAEAGVACTVQQASVDRHAPSLEAAARAARYAAFAAVLQPGDALLLAHHADDQAETLLLRLLRGSGLSGLGAMRVARPFADRPDIRLLRPLLDFPRALVEQEARRRGLSWSEDPSNDDTALDRNFLRHEVIPRLATRWPATVRTLARTARRLAEADDLLAAYLDRDLQPLLAVTSATSRPGLDVAGLLAHNRPLQRALLRRWLVRCDAPLFSEVWLDAVLAIAASRPDAEGKLQAGGWTVQRYRGQLFAFPQLPPAAPDRVLSWSGQDGLDLGAGHGLLQLAASGLALALPAGHPPLTVRFRQGGERCTPAGGEGSRPLKKVLQDLAMPPWLRERVPLLHVGDQLAAVGDLLADAAFAPAAGRPATHHLHWVRPAC